MQKEWKEEHFRKKEFRRKDPRGRKFDMYWTKTAFRGTNKYVSLDLEQGQLVSHMGEKEKKNIGSSSHTIHEVNYS